MDERCLKKSPSPIGRRWVERFEKTRNSDEGFRTFNLAETST